MKGAKEITMLDPTTPKGRILAAALACAATKSWADVTLLDIAEAAQVPLSDLRGLFTSKTDIVAALLRAVDDEVLKRAPKRAEGQETRDRLFDIIMTRFDVLGPHRSALKSIHDSGPADFALAGPYLSSQHWMLQAAGIGTDGVAGGLRLAGLGLAYASVFRVWLEDDDPGLARTMAALDRRLRRGERVLGGLEQFSSAAWRFGEALRTATRAARQGPPKPETGPGPGATAGP
jgi:AcrR family transcriptional regulator